MVREQCGSSTRFQAQLKSHSLSCEQQKMQEKKLSPQLLLHVFVASGKVWHLDLRLSCDRERSGRCLFPSQSTSVTAVVMRGSGRRGAEALRCRAAPDRGSGLPLEAAVPTSPLAATAGAV